MSDENMIPDENIAKIAPKGVASISIVVRRADGTVEDYGEVSRTQLTKEQFQELMAHYRQKLFGEE